ncbi:unnamed protein product [Agarophyton chilense]
MADTWEDCVALLRAGASPSEVLPKLRELMNSEPLPQSSQPQAPCSTDISHSASICRYVIDDVVLQLPYSQPPPTLWTELSNYSDEEFFDSETIIDIMQEFSPIIIGPPEPEIREMLKEFDLSSVSSEGDVKPIDSKEDEKGDQFTKVSMVLQKLIERKDTEDVEEFKVPTLSEAEWAWLLSNINLDGAGKDAVHELVHYVNQPSFSRVILHSILPILADEVEGEDFFELVSITASSADVYSMPHHELVDLMNVYRSLGSKGTLAQLRILCCDEVQ